jgi:formate/nitrite transporter
MSDDLPPSRTAEPSVIERLPQAITFEAVLPAALALRAEESGVKRVLLDYPTVFVLSVLGGAFISLGAVFATTVIAGSFSITSADGGFLSASLPYGVIRLLSGLVFSLGFILVVVSGAELFTGNNMIVMAWASRKVSTRNLLSNWLIVYIGNAVGAFSTAVLMWLTTQYTFGGGAIGLAALNSASAKASLAFVPAFTLGIMCNALVCLATWMCYGARSNVDRVVTIVPPITAFVAAGFEHCIANMYFLPLGLLIKWRADNAFWASIGKSADDYSALNLSNFIFSNLVPVTLGNIIGGSIMVAAVYWFVYLRNKHI